jgi:hypothetical protein
MESKHMTMRLTKKDKALMDFLIISGTQCICAKVAKLLHIKLKYDENMYCKSKSLPGCSVFKFQVR